MQQNQIITPTIHLQRQQDALQKEYLYEKEMYQEQAEKTGIWKKIQQGLCWYPVATGRSYYNSLNQLVVEITRREDKEVEHNFEYGRPVCFFKTNGNGPVCFFKTNGNGKPFYFNFSSTISYVQDDVMVVSLPSPFALTEIQGETDLGIQLYFDETSYKAMFAALKEVLSAKGNRLAELRDILLGKSLAAKRELFP